MKKVFAITNLITAISVGILTPLLAIPMLFIALVFIIPSVVFKEIADACSGYIDAVQVLLQWSFRISNKALKTLREQTNETK